MSTHDTVSLDDPIRATTTWPAVSVTGRASMRQIAEALAGDDIGAALVVQGDSVVGIVSERDIVRHLAEHAHPDHLLADEMMTDELVSVKPDATVREVAETMAACDVRHLPVMDGDEVVGIVSMRDIQRVLLHSLR